MPPEITIDAEWAATVTGLVAVVAIVVALIASSRVKVLTKVFGVGSVYGVHRVLGLIAVGAVVLHIVAVLKQSVLNVVLLMPWAGTPASQAADASAVALVALIASAMWRQRREYDRWRRWHLALTAVAVSGAILHVVLLDHLIKDPMAAAWFAVVAGIALVALVHRWAWRPLNSHSYTVLGVHPESPSVSTVTLTPRQGRHRPNKRQARFSPGQFGWLRLTRHPSMDHPYSFSSSAHALHRVQVTVRRGGNFTEALARSRPGRPVWVDGPHGGFIPSDRAAGLVLIAAGVGVTPMMAMLRTCADRRDRRPIRLIQAAESAAELLFAAEVDQLTKALSLQVTRIVARPDAEWHGRVGRIDLMLLHQVLPGAPMRNQLHYFVCGPPAMVTDTAAALTLAGVPRGQLHTEQFLMPSPKGRSRAPQHARPPAHSAGGAPARVQPRGGGVGRPDDTLPLPVVGGRPGAGQPELHDRRAAQPPQRPGAGHAVRADGHRPPPRPL
uniref:ferredoxin reductase family protein n=1 Tax=Pseudonocardia sp. CA-138482 TaxID=3240023 RepID=UPI003F4927C3